MLWLLLACLGLLVIAYHLITRKVITRDGARLRYGDIEHLDDHILIKLGLPQIAFRCLDTRSRFFNHGMNCLTGSFNARESMASKLSS